MQSAYGYQTPPAASELTSVEAGTPMGELLRRYWQPVCTSDEVKDLPRKEKLLCEEIVLFRDGTGQVGALKPHCAHRGASLEWGRVEDKGLRCCLHGWLYDTQGRCVEMPCETQEFCTRMNVWQPAYPTHEFGGLIFVYMGPPGTEPVFPIYDVVDPDVVGEVELRGMRLWGDYGIGYVKDCNWLQHYENIVDPWHLILLHQVISGNQGHNMLDGLTQEMMARDMAKIDFQKTPLGVRFNMVRELPNGDYFIRHAECIVPNAFLVPAVNDSGARKSRATELSWAVPVDNEHVRGLSIVAWPLEGGAPKPGWRPGTDISDAIRPGAALERSYEERQRKPDDREAQEGQRAIAVHALENLGTSDTGVVMLRRMLREQLKRLEQGLDPLNIVRDKDAARGIPTFTWNAVLTASEAAALGDNVGRFG
ncbi:Rieske 2Fe-2S domain-containing protein [Cupriavidus sp. 2TAF22]|uniref:Rieske 2Fe-2S domain-containing protein n=1 Tax=unclassified Cupriavidus TaxID=2640874 RepID=UPI003F8DC700